MILINEYLKAPEYLSCFDYDDFKVKFISRLLKKKYCINNQQLPQLSQQEIMAIKSLTFYHDIQSILVDILSL